MDPLFLGCAGGLPQRDRISGKPILADGRRLLCALELDLFLALPCEGACSDLRLLWIIKTLKLAKHATVTDTDCSTEDHAWSQLGPANPR